jgi:transcriptional regulator with XRE-family HTH domain
VAQLGSESGKITGMSWERLGREVARRREELHLTQVDVAQRGGPSVATLTAVENNRSGRLSKRLRQALERAIEWEPGSVDAVLNGRAPRPKAKVAGPPAADSRDAQMVAAQRFAVVQRLIKMRQAFMEHRDEMPEAVREAMQEEVAAASRETEEALIWMLPWLGEAERAEAIRILAELQQA